MYTIPHLRAQTTRLPKTPELAALLTSKRQQLAWLRNGSGLVGAGQAARFDLDPTSQSSHEDGRRFALASQWWHDIENAAEIRDEIGQPGSGLVSFGSFSFTPHSPAGSTLIVPQVVVGITGPGTGSQTSGEAFLTLIGPDDQDVFTTLSRQAKELLDAVLVGVLPQYEPIRTARVEPAVDPERYLADIESITRTISEGDVTKVVIARQLDVVADSSIDERYLISHLADHFDDCWTFGVDGLVGATPELLAQSSADGVFTRVLAGTVGKDAADTATELLGSPKILHEHEVAVTSAAESLRKIGSVDVTDPFVLELPNVSHLATDIRTTLASNADALQVAGTLHPTAALGGTPTVRALEIINDVEPTDRDRFGAPVGWLGSGNAGQWCVALRCARIDGEFGARAWAGGGIVADSDPQAELAETEAKFAPIMGAFQV
ncbi:chorismate-binding protein [Arcanobacterium phocisimile]|uniref:Chorismate-binding protein n=1 Tax=Arcanobacterium phocisimile TaxID=1302235 RepID=A0ABX7IH42_9ACTO|nr:chorismate-binding protein [Arcanobacterium phocisimile]QRV02448.1 chorismate-binding protein [Arcanobacterium phocisimile]